MSGTHVQSSFWKTENRVQLENLLSADKEDMTDDPIAVFDWDHTLFHGDIGDSLFVHMVLEEHLFCPENWKLTPFLTPQAADALDNVTTVHPDGRLRSKKNNELCHELFCIYFTHRTTGNHRAFSGFDSTSTHPSYAWFGSLCAGHTPESLQSLTGNLWEKLLAAPPGITIPLKGMAPIPAWGRPVMPLVELYFGLQEAGIIPWIVSASPQFVVEACVRRLGLSTERVIGVRNSFRSEDRTLELSLASCGRFSGMIPYNRGKRCWIQHVIFGVPDPDPSGTPPKLARRIHFAAGDSEGDLAFLEDAQLRLVIAHSENQAVTRARQNPGNWMLNSPLFPT